MASKAIRGLGSVTREQEQTLSRYFNRLKEVAML